MEQVKNRQQQEKLQPNYYAIIPANIRYDKNLNSTEKLIYAEITALCDKEGYCWASNSYFAEILNKLPAYISQVLTKLNKKQYITIEVERNNKGTFRKIYIGKIIQKIHTEKESKIIKKENKTTENQDTENKTTENQDIKNKKLPAENSIEGDIEITIEGLQKKLDTGIEITTEGYRNNYIQKNNTINNTKEHNKEKILKENFENEIFEDGFLEDNFLEKEDFEENEINGIKNLEKETEQIEFLENKKLNSLKQTKEQTQNQSQDQIQSTAIKSLKTEIRETTETQYQTPVITSNPLKPLKTELTSRPSKKQLQQSDPLYSDFLEISNRIKQLIESQKRINISDNQVFNWTTEISKLYKSLESARGSENAIYSMYLMINTLNADTWYEDKYKPVVESGKSFREKFTKIEDYYKRRQMQYVKQKQEDDWDDLVL